MGSEHWTYDYELSTRACNLIVNSGLSKEELLKIEKDYELRFRLGNGCGAKTIKEIREVLSQPPWNDNANHARIRTLLAGVSSNDLWEELVRRGDTWYLLEDCG